MAFFFLLIYTQSATCLPQWGHCLAFGCGVLSLPGTHPQCPLSYNTPSHWWMNRTPHTGSLYHCVQWVHGRKWNHFSAQVTLEEKDPSQLAHLPWTTMGLFPVLLCTTNTCSMTAMMAGGEVHRPSGVQQDIWNWVTLWSSPDYRRRCGGIMAELEMYMFRADCWVHQLMNHTFLKGAGLDVMQSHPLHRMPLPGQPSCVHTFSCLITWGSVILMTRSMKPSCFVAWRTDTLYSPYFCTPLVLPSGQYWWHTSCSEENMVANDGRI